MRLLRLLKMLQTSQRTSQSRSYWQNSPITWVRIPHFLFLANFCNSLLLSKNQVLPPILTVGSPKNSYRLEIAIDIPQLTSQPKPFTDELAFITPQGGLCNRQVPWLNRDKRTSDVIDCDRFGINS